MEDDFIEEPVLADDDDEEVWAFESNDKSEFGFI